MATDLGVQLEIVPPRADAHPDAADQTRRDIVISTLSITPDRAKVIDFSVPYADHRRRGGA